MSVPLDAPVVLLHGVNGAGKSTVMSALELALTGDISGVHKTDREYLVHRGASHAEVSLTTTTGSVGLRIDGENVSGTHLLDAAGTQFFVERCHLQQRNLSRLLDLYESPRRNARSALTEFVNDLLGLDEVEALLSGLYAVGDKRRVKRLIPAYAQLEDRLKALTGAVELKTRELAQFEARTSAARAALLAQLTELGAPERIPFDETAAESWLGDLSRTEEESLTALTGARREVRSLSTRIQQLAPSDTAKRIQALEVDAEAAQARGAAWRGAIGATLSQLLNQTRRVLPGIPAWDGLADPAAIERAARAGIDSEHRRLTARLETDNEARRAAAQLQTALEGARARLLSLDVQLAEASSANSVDTLGSALAALMPHIEGDNCPVCARDYSEVSREPLTSHLASRISELTTQAKRLQDIARARVEAAADIRRVEAGLADQTRRLLAEDVRGATATMLSELHDLTRAFATLRPDVEVGADLIRREIEARQQLAEAVDVDRRRADLQQTLDLVSEQFGVSSRPASLRDQAAALANVIQSQIAAFEARAELNRQAWRTVQTIRSTSAAQLEAEEDLARAAGESRSISAAIGELDRRRTTLRDLRGEVERARTDLVQRVFTTSLNRMWRDLFTRLAPEEPFVPSFGLPETNNQLVATLETVYRDGSTGGRPAAMLSAGNMNTAALTLFLALNLSVEARLPWILLDDPVQSMDEVHVSQLAALLRTLTRDHGRRVVIAVHERPLFDYLALELSPSNNDEGLVAVDLTRGSDGSTSARPTYHTYLEDQAFVSA